MQLVTTQEAIGAMDRAKRISAEAYTLAGPMVNALEAAGERGARVCVTLAGTPYGSSKDRLAAWNARLVAQLRAHHVAAVLKDTVHAKELCVDGTFYFDERNWRRDDLVVRAAPSEAAAIPSTKAGALAVEAQLLAAAPTGDVILETESFGSKNAVYDALKRLALDGRSPRLLVNRRVLCGNSRERSLLEGLVREGVHVRVCSDSSKLAATPNGAWLGSANASPTFAGDAMTDWGVATSNHAIARSVSARLESDWSVAKEFRVPREPERHVGSGARGRLGGDGSAAAGRESMDSAG
ncbi:MAG TPA: hypothetical protein VEW74_05055 [Candidatus Nitrosotalea sp.]|nr:hypothetical protein [Candidatus Nitrosotalea sp.]